MYTFTLLDAFFASVIVLLLMLIAYAWGHTSKMETLTEALKKETYWGDLIQSQHADLEMELARLQNSWMVEKLRLETNALSMLVNQQKALKKLHREALKKYKARCDAKLARQIDTVTASQTVTELPPCTPNHTVFSKGF